MPVLEFSDDLDDQMTTLSQETLQDVLVSLQTPPPVARRATNVAAIPDDPPNTQILQPASTDTAEDSEVPGTSFQRTVVGVQWELSKQMRVGMETMAASLEGMRMCLVTANEYTVAKRDTVWSPAVSDGHSCCHEERPQ
ncbi:hypothetical protein NDU88_002548 [Pleurodeles waltl]|uniref:Uncharacterized protein n=1 Tax=Pleurodeles waltl TaxID=8319 RepID=A0AAV7M487_PLEWA|nr:hypothetical protein NDU88_002548 [Pleurodeles waltl]